MDCLGLRRRRIDQAPCVFVFVWAALFASLQFGCATAPSHSPYLISLNAHASKASEFIAEAEYEKALDSFEKAYMDYEKAEDREGMLLCLERMGWLFGEIGEYSKALQVLRKAHSLGVSLHGDAAEIEADLGSVYMYSGDSEKAGEYCLQALQALQGFTLPTEYMSLPSLKEITDILRKTKAIVQAGVVLGTMRYLEGRPEQALDCLNRANSLIRSVEHISDHPVYGRYFAWDPNLLEGIGYVQTLLGAVYGEAGKPEESRRYFEDGKRAFSRYKMEYGLLVNQGLRYRTELKERIPMGLLPEYEQFLSRAERLGARGILWQTCFVIGQALAREGRNDEAMEYLSRAIRVLELTRSQLREDRTKKMFAASAQDAYSEIIDLCFKMNRLEDGFNYLERAKARAFLDMLEGRRVRAKKDVDPLLVQKEKEMERQIELLSRRLRAGRKNNTEASYEALQQLLSEYRDTLERIKEQSLEFASTTTVATVPAERIAARLGKGTALVSYFIGQDKSIAWIIDAGRIRAVSLDLARRELRTLVSEYREAIGLQLASATSPQNAPERQYSRGLKLAASEKKRVPNVEEIGERLSQALIRPLAQALSGVKRLIVVPSRELQSLPFSSLSVSRGRFLIEDFTLSVLPNASSLFFLDRSIRPGMNRAILMGNPEREEPGMSLAFAEEEARTVSRYFSKPSLWIGNAASETALKESQGSDADIIHIAAHAIYHDRFPLRSALLLAKDAKNDGNLETQEILSMTLTPALVVLSACETGIGKLEGGDEVQSLNRAFLYAGAGAVLSSLWSVSDESTYQLMAYFYEGIGKKAPADSLRDAQLRLMKSYPAVFHWAPFYLIGGMN